MSLSLLPIIPILLFPFILIFFVIVFPFWIIALGVLGLLLGLARLGEGALRLTGLSTNRRLSSALHRAFRWVLTFGGLAERDPNDPDQ
jgi:hypothetical protein